MESNRRSVGLALAAAVLLMVNVAALIGGNGTPGTTDQPNGDATSGTEDPDDGGDEPTAEPSASPDPEDPDDGDPDESEGEDGDGRPAVAVTAPADGTYRYDASGSWSLDDGHGDTAAALPATARVSVTVRKGGGWSARLTAGPRFEDTFSFDISGDDGFDWTTWSMGRPIGGQGGTSVFSCTSDVTWYLPGGVGRVVEHVCARDGTGLRLVGTVEHVDVEDVTLGDGTVVAADHLVHTYSVEGRSTSGQLELAVWLDPRTGLRVREERSIATTTTADGHELRYREDVAFTLTSLDPA